MAFVRNISSMFIPHSSPRDADGTSILGQNFNYLRLYPPLSSACSGIKPILHAQHLPQIFNDIVALVESVLA